jgi:hypothetical protein
MARSISLELSDEVLVTFIIYAFIFINNSGLENREYGRGDSLC